MSILLNDCINDLNNQDYEINLLTILKILHLKAEFVSDKEKVPLLLENLAKFIKNNDFETLIATVFAMGHIVDIFSPKIDNESRASLLKAIQNSLNNAEKLAQRLFLLSCFKNELNKDFAKTFLEQDNLITRLAAVCLFISSIQQNELKFVLSYLGYEQAFFRKICLFQLRHFKPAILFDALEAQLQEKDIYLRIMTLRSLSYMPGNGATIRILLLASRDPVEEVRLSAIPILKAFNHQATKIRLEEMRSDISITVCEKVEEYLKREPDIKITDLDLENPRGFLY